MKTKEELTAMSHEELVDYSFGEIGTRDWLNEQYREEIERLKELIAAIGIVYDTYKREKK